MNVSLIPLWFACTPAPEKGLGNTQAAGFRHLCAWRCGLYRASHGLLSQNASAIIRDNDSPESIVHSDGWEGNDGLVDVWYDKHFRINKSKRVAGNSVHINDIEALWNFTKRCLAKLNSVKRNFKLSRSVNGDVSGCYPSFSQPQPIGVKNKFLMVWSVEKNFVLLPDFRNQTI